jgi:hypothetical protein
MSNIRLTRRLGPIGGGVETRMLGCQSRCFTETMMHGCSSETTIRCALSKSSGSLTGDSPEDSEACQ